MGDLYRDGHLEIVDTDLDGKVYVWSATGQRLATMSVNPAYSRDDPADQNEFNRTKPQFASSPSLGDLDGDGKLEIVAAAMDRHVYAWHADGTPVAGFPVLLVDPTKVASVDPVSHEVTFTPSSGVGEGGELVATPTVADVNGDGRPEIVVGGAGAVRRATQHRRRRRRAGPAGRGRHARQLAAVRDVAGWAPTPITPTPRPTPTLRPTSPAGRPRLSQLATSLLPTIGDGVAMPAVVGDVDPAHPGPEIVAASSAGTLYVLDAQGHSVYGSTAAGDFPVAWAGGLALQNAGRFGAESQLATTSWPRSIGLSGPTIGELQGGGTKEIAANTAGLTRFIDLLAPDLQLPNDDQLSAWDGATGNELTGSPHTTADLALFVAPAIADLDGDGHNEVIAGNGSTPSTPSTRPGTKPAGLAQADRRVDASARRRWATGTATASSRWPSSAETATCSCGTPRARRARPGVRTAATPTTRGRCVDTSPATVVPPTTTSTTAGPAPSTTAGSPATTQSAAGPTATAGGGTLPLTGADTVVLLLAAAGLIAAGTWLVAWRRRRLARREL